MRARAAKSGLHLVGDAHAAGAAHVFVGVAQVALGKLDEAAYALDGLCDERGDLARRREVDELLHVVGVFFAGGGIVIAPRAAIGVGRERVVDAEAVRDVELPRAVRGEAHGGGVAAMVGVAQGDDVVVARVGARHEEGEVVGLGTGVHEIADLQVAGHLRGEGGGVFGDLRLEVDRGRVLERGGLIVRGGDDLRMTMADADGDNAAEAVEVALAGLVPDILHAALHEHDRFFVVEKDAGIQNSLRSASTSSSEGPA